MLINNKSLIKTIKRIDLTNEQETNLNEISNIKNDLNNIKNTELENLNTAINTLETLVGLDEAFGNKSGLPEGDANIIASINRIDRKTTTGNGLTSEQAQQLTTAYEHSQSPHINTTDVNNAVSTYVTAHKAELKGDKGDKGDAGEKGDTGAKGDKGDKGDTGATGANGVTPTLKVGSTTTGNAGTNATVTMTDSNNVYTLNFVIPRGDKGDTGAKGEAGAKGQDGVKGADGITPTLRVGSVTTLAAGSNATVTMSENSNVYTLNFGIPKGAKGDVGTGSTDNTFQNKIANFLGDSQTEVNSHKTKIYHDWVKEILGLSVVNNYGISGTTIAKKNTSDNTAMCVRYANMDNNADLICVMGGVNDRWFNCQLGKFGDSDPITFYGAMETLCNGLLTKYPGKTIIFITPTEQNNNSCNSANTTGYTPTDFANAMKRVCAKYSIPVFDANTCSGIYPLNEANASIYTTDKLHLNNKGHEVLGNKLSKFILNGANVVMINSGSSEGGTGDTYGNIVVSKSTATISEGGTDTFTVKLDKAPTNSQTVNISSNNSDVTLSTNTLTFTPDNYNQTQEVRINVAEDSDAVNDNCTLTLSSNNVSSKTITITITDNDSASGEPDVPSENQFIGKTVTVTKNFNNGNFLHLTALLTVEEDMRTNSTYDIVFRGSNVSNMGNASNIGGALFSDNSGEVSNGSYVEQMGIGPTFTQTVSDGNLTISAPSRNAAITTNYVKVPIVISGTIPYSFQIDEIKVIVNGTERKILKLGSFFASDKEIVTIE